MKINLLSIAVLLLGLVKANDSTLISFGDHWKYLDDGSNQGTNWKANSFDDSGWGEGPAPLGYGNSNENTTVSYGSDANNKYITTYFRKTVVISDVSEYVNSLMKIIRDDGAVICVNGQAVMITNMWNSSPAYNTKASTTASGSEETNIYEEFIPISYFQNGENVIAVEVHQRSGSSSDLTFDLELILFDEIPSLYREPYIQMSTESSIVVKWMTDAPCLSVVNYGESSGNLNVQVVSVDSTMNHELLIEGLTSSSSYYYNIGTSSEIFIGGDDTYFFKTNPVIGTSVPTRIWVTGDAGTGHSGQLDVRDSYVNYVGQNGSSDLWLMMGDNAYEHGRQNEYHLGLFDVYQDVMKNTVSFPTAGNHDLYGPASATTETGPYYDIFALPSNGESGGVASNKESYYSFDYGNIHFICLESYELDRDSLGAMALWLKQDLEQTNADWLIAYWHYAPYTKVGHDSDDPNDHDGRAIEIREQIVPILERYGVDLVLGGHSHGYERSYFVNGHYGYSNSLSPDMVIDNGDGDMNGDGAYYKPESLTANNGTVYAVCGNSGKLSSAPSAPHPVMYTTNTSFMGSMVIDIEGDTLEGKFLNENGIIQDYFHIVKDSVMASLEEPNNDINVRLSPNPATEFAFISNLPDSEKISYEMYSVEGKLVKAGEREGEVGSVTIKVGDLPAGIYTIKILSDNNLLESKLLVIQ